MLKSVIVRTFYHWRKSRGLTQAEAAKLAGVSIATIMKIETGKGLAKFSTHRKIIDKLGLKPGDIFFP